MNTERLQHHFARIGATLQVTVIPEGHRRFWWREEPDFALDIVQTKRGEAFDLTVQENALDKLEFQAVDMRPKDRHLLLMARREDPRGFQTKDKFLCGHDERHWFVAAVPGVGVANVKDAMEALKPDAVRHSQRRHRVKPRHRNKRRNAGFVRQGEWFFLPRPQFDPMQPYLVFRNEPIQRGGGKPHMVEELYRVGGETVYVTPRYPNGLTEVQYQALLKRDAKAAKLNWRIMRRNPMVFARGKVRHPDHETIVLSFWHLVVMNSESETLNVVFLD